MVKKLLNIMRMQSEATRDAQSPTRQGLVSAYDQNNYCIKVMIQPENTETGWIPLRSPWIGNGWGLFCPPSIGDEISLDFQEGNFEAGLAGLRSFNNVDRPLPTPSGEFWLVHKTGSFLKFFNDGSVEVHTHQDLRATVGRHLTATVAGNASATVTGNFNATITGTGTMSAASWGITGDITLNGNFHASGNVSDSVRSMAADRVIYNGHTHGGVQTGGGNTAAPNQPE